MQNLSTYQDSPQYTDMELASEWGFNMYEWNQLLPIEQAVYYQHRRYKTRRKLFEAAWQKAQTDANK